MFFKERSTLCFCLQSWGSNWSLVFWYTTIFSENFKLLEPDDNEISYQWCVQFWNNVLNSSSVLITVQKLQFYVIDFNYLLAFSPPICSRFTCTTILAFFWAFQAWKRRNRVINFYWALQVDLIPISKLIYTAKGGIILNFYYINNNIYYTFLHFQFGSKLCKSW